MIRRFLFALSILSMIAVFPGAARAEATSEKKSNTPITTVIEKTANTFLEYAAEAEASVPEKSEKISIAISFAGDCTLGSDLKYGKSGSFIQVFENQAEPYKYFFSNVLPVFEDDDLTVVNLEGPLTNTGAKADKEFAFRGKPEFTGILSAGGIELVNLANNHSNDYGIKGYEDTIKNLDAAGIASYGLDKPYITQINGIKIGFLGYKGWSADAGIKNKVAGDIKTLKDGGANVVIVTFHGGDEAVYYPNNAQKTLYRHAVDSGADLVLGHHPHVVQGIELHNGKYIVYSLGNFSFGGNRNPSDKDTFVFRQTFEFDADTYENTGYSAEIVPCSISGVSSRNDFRPTPLTGDAALRLKEKINKLSLALNNNKNIFDDIGIYVIAGD